jgi:hypothetical protein
MQDRAVLAAALAAARDDIERAVRDWRALGGRDEELALHVDGEHSSPPRVTPHARAELQLTIADFDPTIAIEFAKHPPGQAPVVVELPGMARHITWIDLATLAPTPAH